ncbi:MAG: ATP phosphoribosyltransferase regulatory subunit [Treponema sp.]|nr:ATP phosphoribosyltransferase regulatory subunit [Treponema sp.]
MKVNALKGMKDILPQEQRIRDYIQGKILETYRASGFERISTPILEDSENIDKSDGGDNLNLVFKVLKRGEKLEAALASEPSDKTLSDMGLRYDLTLPLSRFYAANHNELQFPFKVIQTDRVYRAERPQKGRLREFVQCDIDILGDSSCNAEVELIDVTARAMLSIGFNDFTINVNDRRILRNMLENMGFAPETLDSVCITFDKLDKIGAAGIEAELKEKQFPENAVSALVSFISSGEISLDAVSARCSDPSVADDLKYVIATATEVSGGKYKIAYCPNLVRGQGYYTGMVFEIACPGFSGAVGGGGRYDNMIGKFLGQNIPAVGFSIGFERICGILLEQNYKIPDQKEKCALLYGDEISYPQVLLQAEKLRKDYIVGVIHKAKKAGPQFAMLETQGYTKFAQFKDGAWILK